MLYIPQDLEDILTKDFQQRGLPLSSRLCLERRALTADTNRLMEEPPPKRPKRERGESVPPEEGLCAYNALRDALENKTSGARFWQLVKGRPAFTNTVLNVSG